MRVPIAILSVFLMFLLGCNDDSYEKRETEARKDFITNASIKEKELVKNFLEGKIQYGDHISNINGGFYCLWKRGEDDMYPHIVLDEMFKNNGFNITTKKDSLKFIVVSENKSHKVGNYSNGGEAFKMETIISVIDIKKELAYTINKTLGSDPPTSIVRSNGSDYGSAGSSMSDQDIFNFLKQNIIKK